MDGLNTLVNQAHRNEMPTCKSLWFIYNKEKGIGFYIFCLSLGANHCF